MVSPDSSRYRDREATPNPLAKRYDRVNAMSTRRFWQIHLSTAVVLMVLAGGILAINLKTTRRIFVAFQPASILDDRYSYEQMVGFYNGWPTECRRTEGYVPSRQDTEIAITGAIPNLGLMDVAFVESKWPEVFQQLELDWNVRDPGLLSSGWIISNTLINFATAIALLTATAIACELTILLRHEARKP